MSSLYSDFIFAYLSDGLLSTLFSSLLTFSSESRENPFPGALSQDLTIRDCLLRFESQKEKRRSYFMMVVSSTDMGKQ